MRAQIQMGQELFMLDRPNPEGVGPSPSTTFSPRQMNPTLTFRSIKDATKIFAGFSYPF